MALPAAPPSPDSPQFGQVTHVIVYPIKSCAAVQLDAPSEFTKLGLRHDRAWSVIDASSGDVLTLRDRPDLVKIRPRLEADAAGRVQWLVLARADDAATVRVPVGAAAGTDAGEESAAWLKQVLGSECRLRRTPAAFDSLPFSLVFADDLDALAQRLVPPDPRPREVVTKELLLRFRPNFVVSGISSAQGFGALAIGGVLLEAHANRWADGCLRVVQVDPNTGEVTDEPAAALRRSVTARPSEHPSKWEPVFGVKLSGGTDVPNTVAPGHIVIAEASKEAPQLVRGVPDDKLQEEASLMEKDARMAAAAQALALGQAACSSKAMLMANAWQPAGPVVPNKGLPVPTNLKEVSRGGTDIELSWSLDGSAVAPSEFTVQYGYRLVGDWTTAPAPELMRESAAILPPAANFADDVASKPPAREPLWKAKVVGLVGYTSYVFRVRAKIDGEWSYWSPTSRSIATRWSAHTRTTKATTAQLSWVPCDGVVCSAAPTQPDIVSNQPNSDSTAAGQAAAAREDRVSTLMSADTSLEPLPQPGPSTTSTAVKITLKVDGMMCGGCQANVKKALEAVEGVSSATVELDPGSAIVVGSASAEVLIQAVVAAGKKASLLPNPSMPEPGPGVAPEVDPEPKPEPEPEPDPEPEPNSLSLGSRFLPPSFLMSTSQPSPEPESDKDAKPEREQSEEAPPYQVSLLLDEPGLFRGCENQISAPPTPSRGWLPKVPSLRWSTATPAADRSATDDNHQESLPASPPAAGQLKLKYVEPGTREATDIELIWKLTPATIEPLEFEIEYGFRVRGAWKRTTQVTFSVETQASAKLSLKDTRPGSGQPRYAHGIAKPEWMTKQIKPRGSEPTSATSRQVEKLTAECLALRTSSSSDDDVPEPALVVEESPGCGDVSKLPASKSDTNSSNELGPRFMARIAGLTSNTSYTFRIRARDAVGWGAWKSSSVISTLSAAPSRVSRLPTVHRRVFSQHACTHSAPAVHRSLHYGAGSRSLWTVASCHGPRLTTGRQLRTPRPHHRATLTRLPRAVLHHIHHTIIRIHRHRPNLQR
jgi:uncharacterized protein YcbX/copper chaperone CopZ|eukprot:COSAG06_NODE_308_length_17789_cov_16.732335_2_plen_1049_part_00